MGYENPFLVQLDNYSDDEIFEILRNTDETKNPEKYVAAISIALKRRLISEYQSIKLLEGNIKVLEYSPEKINKDIEDYTNEEELRQRDVRTNKISKTQYGLIFISIGAVLLFIGFSSDVFFPILAKLFGLISILSGLLFIISEKVKKPIDK